VVVQSFRPAVMARYGLDWSILHETHPALVYCSVSGFGASGPAADLPAGDSTMQAWGGLMSIIGDANTPPTRVGNVVTDMLAGMNAFQGTLLALMDRQHTGRGCHVEVALLDSLVAFQAPAFAEYLSTGLPPPRTGNNHPLLAPSGLFEAADGALVFSVLAHQWQAFCNFFAVPTLAADPRFTDNALRMANREALMAILRPLFKSEKRAVVLERLRACDVPCAPVNDFAAVAADPQVQINGLLGHVEHPKLGSVPFVRNPVLLDGADTARGHVPLLGEHSESILAGAGYTRSEIERLLEESVVHTPAPEQPETANHH
jgi:crotonobetainyl-CoA:carnitine CoA-transferase CaiB-like acyl-CoA transferase